MSNSKPIQSKIDSFFTLKAGSSKSVVTPIIEELISGVFKTKRAHVKVNEATVQSWKTSYQWLILLENNKEVRLKCAVCEKYHADNIWATEGAVNIQKSAIDRTVPAKITCHVRRKMSHQHVYFRKVMKIVTRVTLTNTIWLYFAQSTNC